MILPVDTQLQNLSPKDLTQYKLKGKIELCMLQQRINLAISEYLHFH